MYEDRTYETILKRMLNRVPSDLDKREGSVVYTALAPAAAELASMYVGLDWMLEQMFIDTQGRECLVRRCAEAGISPKPATFAEGRGEFNLEIPLGSRFSAGPINYTAVAQLSPGVYRMRCETAGEEGNRHLGTMIPINYIPGLIRAELTEILVPGEEEESTESLRNRYLIKIRKPSTSGNRYDYYNWAMECSGVGAVKVFPLSDGPGTVKVVITDAARSAAGAELVEEVRAHIEELRPIGAKVSVVSAVEKGIHVTARIRLANGINLGQVEDGFARTVEEYLKANAFDASYISLARIGSLLLDTVGVEDFENLCLNGAAANVSLGEEDVAVLGTVILEVM